MRIQEMKREPPSISQIFALVLWCGCLTVGILGLCLRYLAPAPVEMPPQTVQAELLTVPVTPDPVAENSSVSPEHASPSDIVPAAPPLPAVAQPSAAIAFALPVEGPAQTVDAAHASFARPDSNAPMSRPVQRLTFGQGEGAQPSPEYPVEALAAGEEGAVGVRFTVRKDGRVAGANVVSASRWPLLNNAARDVIQNRWHFTGGTERTYEVVIRFHINS